MKLKDYMDQLKDLADQDPGVLELDVIYAKDDEGNGFSKVHYEPSVGVLMGDEFSGERKFNENCNAVCLN